MAQRLVITMIKTDTVDPAMISATDIAKDY